MNRNPPAAEAAAQPAEIVREYGPFGGDGRVHGVSHDGRNVWAALGTQLLAFDPASGAPVKTLQRACDAGTAFDGKHLYQIAEARIDKIDPATGRVIRSIESNRFVTGVSWVDGELWHGTWEGDESELRRVDATTGDVRETIGMPAGTMVSGLESDGRDRFYCGGGRSGKVRVVLRDGKSR